VLTLNLSSTHLMQSGDSQVEAPLFAQILPSRLAWTRLAEGIAVEAVMLSALLLAPTTVRSTPDRTEGLRSPRTNTTTLIAPPRLRHQQHQGGWRPIRAHEGSQLSVPTEQSQSVAASPTKEEHAAVHLAQPELPEKKGPGLPLPPARIEPVLPVREGVPLGATFSTISAPPLLPGARSLGSRSGPKDDGHVIQRADLLPGPTLPFAREAGFGLGTSSPVEVLRRPRSNAPMPPTASSHTAPEGGISIISMPRPEYTTCARQNRLEGFVRVRALFASTGVVANTATIGQPLGCGLEESAQAAVREAKFKPAHSGGKEIDKWVVVVAHFQLAVQTLSVQ
jgi:TonB family protein